MERLIFLLLILLPGCYDYCSGCRIYVATTVHATVILDTSGVTGELGDGLNGLAKFARREQFDRALGDSEVRPPGSH